MFEKAKLYIQPRTPNYPLEDERDYVATVQLPRFRPTAQVLVWGERTFKYVWRSGGMGEYLVYHECFAYVVLPGSEVDKVTP